MSSPEISILKDPNKGPENLNAKSIDQVSRKDISEFGSDASAQAAGLRDFITARRFQRATPMNPNSSRSHVFIELSLCFKSGKENPKVVFCDLGGNEKLTEYEGKPWAFFEGEFIVKSLLDLKSTLNQYAQGTQITPPKYSKGSLYVALDRYLNFNSTSTEIPINKFIFLVHTYGFLEKGGSKNEIIKATTLDTLKLVNEIVRV
jgi:hypothetical protein